MQPGSRMAHFEVLGLIGSGGMGEVYRARDTRLGRDVAIKVLPLEFASDRGRLHRFEQEAKAVAALDHPNILAIHDVGTHEGSPYLVTELLEGETLRERLEGEGLTVRKAVEVGIQIARGLTAAHGKGIVHRDLKPSNVFLTEDGQVKLLDFGLAKLTRPEPAPGAPTEAAVSSTETGAVMGTVGYMSPEQVRGMPADHRSDIFAFGCLLYEVLSGERPFRGDTTSDVMAAILQEDPAPLPARVPPALQGIVTRCLEKRPEDRFTSAHDLALALRVFSGAGETPATLQTGLTLGARLWARRRWLAVGGIATLLIAVATAVWLWKGKPGAPGPDLGLKRIAVLPFENLGAAEDAYFADGMTDEVRGKLASLSGLAVIARNSSDQYKGTTKTPKQIAEELSTPFLFTAKVRWQKGGGTTSRIRVSPELVEVSGAGAPTTRWQDSFDAELQDVFRVQSDIATRIASSLRVALTAGEKQRLVEPPTTNLAAYDAYLRGQEIQRGLSGPRDRFRVVAQYEQAVALDPSFVLAWAQLSQARCQAYMMAADPGALAEGAREAAARALQLAPGFPEARLAMGDYHLLVARNAARAREEYVAGLAVNPRHSGLLIRLASTDKAVGRWDEAVAHLEQARSLDPRSEDAESHLGWTLLHLRRYPEALAALDRALALNPANLLTIQWKAVVFCAQGDLAGARAVVAAASRQIEPTALVAFFARSIGLPWLLDETQQQLLLRLTPAAFNDNRATWAISLADACALRGDMAQARRYAEEAHTAYVRQLAEVPDDGLKRANNGLALAYLGRRGEAIREGERAATLTPLGGSWLGTSVLWLRARIHIVLGDHEEAIDLLEQLVREPFFVTPGWLSIDPHFAPVRGNPRFERLLGTYARRP